jgi:hypothetical protein
MKTLTSKGAAHHLFVLGLGLAAAMSSGQAFSNCSSYSPGRGELPSSTKLPAAVGMMPALYRPGAELLMVSDYDQHNSIVGMWRVTSISDGTAYPVVIPFGAVLDFGTQQWHGDGTEFLISGARAPSTGDVCMGVWEQIGPRTFKLKHIALAYNSSDTAPPVGPVSPATFVGPAIIKEVVTLDHSGDAFEGSFTLDQYAQDEVTLLEHVGGKVTGTRFKVD